MKTLSEEIFDNAPESSVEPVHTEEELRNNGLANLILDLITDENEAIQGYIDFQSSLSNVDPDFSELVNTIIDEEMNHVGMLQFMLKKVSPSADMIESGSEEAEEELEESFYQRKHLHEDKDIYLNNKDKRLALDISQFGAIEDLETTEEKKESIEDELSDSLSDAPYFGGKNQPKPEKIEVPKALDESIDTKKEVFRNDNGTTYDVIERSASGEHALLNKGKSWIVAWNCPKGEGSWGQGHYFFSEEDARKLWDEKYVNESIVEHHHEDCHHEHHHKHHCCDGKHDDCDDSIDNLEDWFC